MMWPDRTALSHCSCFSFHCLFSLFLLHCFLIMVFHLFCIPLDFSGYSLTSKFLFSLSSMVHFHFVSISTALICFDFTFAQPCKETGNVIMITTCLIIENKKQLVVILQTGVCLVTNVTSGID